MSRISAAALAAVLAVAFSFPAEAAQVQAFFGKETLPYAWVTGVFRDGDDVWVGTKDGTRIFRPGDRSWGSLPAGIEGKVVTGLARYGGVLYVATEKSLNVACSGGWKPMARIENAEAVNGDLAVSGKILWMAARTMIGGLLQYDGESWKLLSRGRGTGVMNNITRLEPWKGELWAGTVNNGIYRWKSGEWTVLGPENGVPGLFVTSLAGTEEGMYAGTPDGLGYFDGETWRTYNMADGLPSNKVSVLKVYKNKVIIGTFDRGISVFDGRRFKNIGRAQGLSDDRVQAVEVVGDTVWVGTVNGLNLVRIS
jgi:ligand-binding sensor domain-containing protein